MRGFILNLKKHRDEDMIVSVLCSDRLLDLYRFYGARHSPLQLGYKIDFTVERDMFFMPRLRGVSHLGYGWLFDLNAARAWQRFAQLLFKHLRGTGEIDDFYYLLLDRAAKKMEVQHPKRVIIEAAAELFDHEGRLHTQMRCLICEEAIADETIALKRAFFPAHTRCAYSEGFARKAVERLFETKESLLFSDLDIARLWRVIEEGL
ncbi:MAG: recombination protein RecO [Helicobacteraceae bacterium]|jgi:hypothetical protein|nr:recombination protein RecO [Helicobacteraceae bacterium]